MNLVRNAQDKLEHAVEREFINVVDACSHDKIALNRWVSL